MSESRNWAMEAERLLPYLLPWLRQGTARDGGTAPALGVHDLNGGLHLGTLEDSQAPQFLKTDGTRDLTGNWGVKAGITIDGVDLSAHAADPAAHHAPATAGDGIGVSGQQVSLLATVAGAGLGYTAGVLAVGVAGLGLSVNNDAVTLTSSSNPGVAASVLASDASGNLALVRLTLADRVRSPLIDTASGNLVLTPATGVTTLAELHAASRVRSPLIDTASGNLVLTPATDLLLSPGSNIVRLMSGRMLQSDGYASQVTGMRISAAGEADFRYLYTDELHAKSFIADLEQALAGGQIISKSVAVLAVNFVLPTAGNMGALTVRDLPSAPNMAVFESNDFIGLRQFSRSSGNLTIGWAWGTVTGYTDQPDGTQTWIFTRHASTPGAASGTIAAESLALDFGQTGNGFYEVNAIDGLYGLNSPYWRIVTWAGHPATQTVRVQGGNLRGLFGVGGEYGLFAGNGTSISSAYLRLSNLSSMIQNIPIELYESGSLAWRLHPTYGMNVRFGAFGGSSITFSEAIGTGQPLASLFAGNSASQTTLSVDVSTTGAARVAQTSLRAQNDDIPGANPLVVLQKTPGLGGTINLIGNYVRANGEAIWHTGNFQPTNYPGILGVTGATGSVRWNDRAASSDFWQSYHASGTWYLLHSNGVGSFQLTSNNQIIFEGVLGYAWGTPVLSSGWDHAGGGNSAVGYRRFGDLITIKGRALTTSSHAANATIYILPTGYRPAGTRTFAVPASTGTLTMNVMATGVVRISTAVSSGVWVSVEATFMISD